MARHIEEAEAPIMRSKPKAPRLTRSSKKINKNATNNLVGLLLLLGGIVLLTAFFIPDGTFQTSALIELKDNLIQNFGTIGVAFPLLLISSSVHFFKLPWFKKYYVRNTIGAMLLFIASIMLFQSGKLGSEFYTLLSLTISVFGTWLLGIVFIIAGLLLFTNSSLEDIYRFIVWVFKGSRSAMKGIVKKDSNEEIDEIEEDVKYITDEKLENKKKEQLNSANVVTNVVQAPQSSQRTSDTLKIRQYINDDHKPWKYPNMDLLENIQKVEADRGNVSKIADTIEETLESFGIRAKVQDINYGPTVTQYALQIAQGTKLSKITTLNNDIALTTAAQGGMVRIEAPIPGRSLVGIEIPNKKSEIVTIKKMMQQDVFKLDNDPLLIPLGLDVSGKPTVYSISKMPHVLIAGTTGSGKSVIVNAWISTFLMRTQPTELQMIMIDPKRVELTPYNGIPHLMTEVIVEPEKAISALKWSVNEMENRYKKLAEKGVRGLVDYNNLGDVDRIPYLIIIIDELADLMMVGGKDVESYIVKIAQKARAVGIHLVVATQRPSTDVITGLMKANIPTRLAFNVPSLVDSRIIIDQPGAENLLGKGDMLFLPPDSPKPKRIQGPLVVTKEIERLVTFLKSEVPVVNYTSEITQQDVAMGYGDSAGGTGEVDPLFHKALSEVMNSGKASASFLQRRMGLGYNRAAKILDQMEAGGYIGPANGSKPREIIRRVGEN